MRRENYEEKEKGQRGNVYVLLIWVLAVTSIFRIEAREMHLHGGGCVAVRIEPKTLQILSVQHDVRVIPVYIYEHACCEKSWS